MIQSVYSLVEKCIQHSNEEELEVLQQLLTAHLEKVEGNGSYIGRVLQMERKIEEDICTVSTPITPFSNNVLEIVHGGITATVLDSAMGTIANHAVPEGYTTVTSNLNIHYIAAGTGNKMVTTAKIIHKGSKTIVVEGETVREDGRKMAFATGTFFIIKKIDK